MHDPFAWCFTYDSRMEYSNLTEPKDDIPELPEKSEQYMSSKEWLQKYGLDSRKLGLFDLLSGVAFKHQDGVVEVKEAPPDETTTDAVSIQALDL